MKVCSPTKVNTVVDVLIDEVNEEEAVGRTIWDAPDIDGAIYVDCAAVLSPGDRIKALVTHSEDYDLWGTRVL